jgi:hypothetical protein
VGSKNGLAYCCRRDLLASSRALVAQSRPKITVTMAERLDALAVTGLCADVRFFAADASRHPSEPATPVVPCSSGVVHDFEAKTSSSEGTQTNADRPVDTRLPSHTFARPRPEPVTRDTASARWPAAFGGRRGVHDLDARKSKVASCVWQLATLSVLTSGRPSEL